MINENYLDYDFTWNNDEEEIKRFLLKLGFKKIGHIKPDACGYCIRLRDKSFFECSSLNNPQIETITEIEELKTKLLNYENAKRSERRN